MNREPLVSVVITTRNEEKNIRTCLQSIACQSLVDVEIIVIDNSSSDQTKKISREYTQHVFDKGPERSAQRNFGIIDKASGKFALYVDADMLLSQNLLEACVTHMESHKDTVALYVGEIILGTRYLSRVRRFERSFYDGTPIDGIRFFRREAFIACGGFDEKTFRVGSGEDWDIAKTILPYGTLALLNESTITSEENWMFRKFINDRGVTLDPKFVGFYHNETEVDLVQYFKKKRYYSKGFDPYKKKWGRDDPDIKFQLGFVSRYLLVFFRNGGWRRLVTNPALTFGLYFMRFLVGLAYLTVKNGRIK